MRIPEYDQLDATALASAVRGGDLDARELVDAAIERIEARDPNVNAVVTRCFEEARRQATQVDRRRPFAGVPLLVKDLCLEVAGVPTRNGSRFYEGVVPVANSLIVQRWLDAGFVILGKTATPELGAGVTTEPDLTGPTRNPWDASKTVGGSSGGSAAAVAARMVPVATASDGGGSIRIPSSCCGVFGLKPSRGRVPSGSRWSEQQGGMAVEHAVTRSVRDSAGILDFLSLPAAGNPYTAPQPPSTFLQAAGSACAPLRIGFFDTPTFPATTHPECAAALERSVRLMRELGHDVVGARPPVDGTLVVQQLFRVTAGLTWAQIHDDAERLGRRPRPRDFEVETWTLAALGKSLSAGDFALTADRLQRLGGVVAEWMREHRIDVTLSPTLAQPPWALGALRSPSWVRFLSRWAVGGLGLGGLLIRTKTSIKAVEGAFSAFPFTPLQNLTGQPSMSVPLERSSTGLPIGLLFSARYGDEATLFRLAAQLEAARPWASLLPPSCGQAS